MDEAIPMDEALPWNASGKESAVSSDTSNLHVDYEIIPWIFSREDIENNSPSRRDGIDLETETRLRYSYCRYLKKLGENLKVPQVITAIAIVFCHRFFTRQSHSKNDRATIATACMFLAGKVEETPVDLKELILATCVRLQDKDLSHAQKQEAYEQHKELLFNAEKLVLSTLNFDVFFCHPYKPLVEAIKKYMGEEDTKTRLPKVAWTVVTDSLKTTLSLQYKPHQIAAGALFIAYDIIQVDLPYGEVLCQEFDITASQLDDIKGQMVELYENTTSEESIVESSGGVAVVQQPDIEGGSLKVNLSQSEDHSVHGGSRPEGIDLTDVKKNLIESFMEVEEPHDDNTRVEHTEIVDANQSGVDGEKSFDKDETKMDLMDIEKEVEAR